MLNTVPKWSEESSIFVWSDNGGHTGQKSQLHKNVFSILWVGDIIQVYVRQNYLS